MYLLLLYIRFNQTIVLISYIFWYIIKPYCICAPEMVSRTSRIFLQTKLGFLGHLSWVLDLTRLLRVQHEPKPQPRINSELNSQ